MTEQNLERKCGEVCAFQTRITANVPICYTPAVFNQLRRGSRRDAEWEKASLVSPAYARLRPPPVTNTTQTTA